VEKVEVLPAVQNENRVSLPTEMTAHEVAHVTAAILAHRHLTPVQRSLMERFYMLLHEQERHAQQRMSHYAHQISRVQEALPAFKAIEDHGDIMDDDASEEISDLNSDY
jgi:galactokinase